MTLPNIMRKRNRDIRSLKKLISFCDLDSIEMVEIGSYAGESTEIFSSIVKVIYAVDPWENGYDSWDQASWKIEMSQ